MPHLLLCPPYQYGIEYEINPWMDRATGANRDLALGQWRQLHETLLKLGCIVEIIEARAGLPDMVFTANAGLVIGTKFIRSNFRYPQRQGEALLFEKWFAEHGFEVVRLPENLIFEGEGDALFAGDILFCGYRFRSDIHSHQWLGDLLKSMVISVELIDARFYHLDTCFSPLSRPGEAIWYPAAFDDYGQKAIRQHIAVLIETTPQEALRFACNAVVIGDHILLPDGCPELRTRLSDRNYIIHELAMSEFIKAGGACKCLTLFLPQR